MPQRHRQASRITEHPVRSNVRHLARSNSVAWRRRSGISRSVTRAVCSIFPATSARRSSRRPGPGSAASDKGALSHGADTVTLRGTAPLRRTLAESQPRNGL
jgi:ribosomal protein L19E